MLNDWMRNSNMKVSEKLINCGGDQAQQGEGLLLRRILLSLFLLFSSCRNIENQ